jgi:hypothetical protein
VRGRGEGQLPALPRAEDLPADIRDLVHYQKHDVTHERFGRDIGELIEAITVHSGAPKFKELRMDWGRLVTDDANETDLLRSYVVRVTDATFGYMAEQAAAESGVPAADGHERMWMLLERGALRLVGPITDDDRIGVEPCDSNEWHEQAKKNRPLVEWRRQMAPTGDSTA